MSSSGFSPSPPPVFNGEGYHIWVAFDLWEVVNSDVEPPPLRANPTMAQIRQHSNDRAKRYKVMSCIPNSVRLDLHKDHGLSDFENLKMKEEETVKQYSDRIMFVVNSIRLLGDQFSEARMVEKVIATLLERYEAKISSIEDSRDLSSITLTELINALCA
ncbi:pleiotropic drug resistance protein 3-like [Gossypium australe]|uniref:Pleiotropic drug resistance protein 3-like n=1 Tax=Gossypium australe TaxID=47621 RepID=A0A5B6WP80_9ROSI|nr:pleiotropic drug resistance protein 3-like [Gossypium australe]